MYEWDFTWTFTYREQLFRALVVTLHLNLLVLLIGSVAGLVLGILARSPCAPVRWFTMAYADLFRSLPVLVGLVWAFYCLPILAGGIRIGAYTCAVIVLALNLSAFVAEIIRASLQSVPQGIIESARALGLSQVRTIRRIIAPLTARLALPPLLGQYINTIKLSVLASAISVPELLHRTTDLISQTYRPLEFYTVLALLFLAILIPMTVCFRLLEQKFSHFKL